MEQSFDFTSLACNNCGWCCQRSACPLGIYQGASPVGPCRFLESQGDQHFCGLINSETNEIKKAAALELILADQGCTHKFGPHPVSLLKELLQKGLVVNSPQWQEMRRLTQQEMAKTFSQSQDPHTLVLALDEFNQFCDQQELKND